MVVRGVIGFLEKERKLGVRGFLCGFCLVLLSFVFFWFFDRLVFFGRMVGERIIFC